MSNAWRSYWRFNPTCSKHDLEHFAEKKAGNVPNCQKEPTESADTSPKKLSRLEQLERYLTFLLVRGTPADAIVRLEQLEAIPVQSALLSALVKERQSLVDAETFEPLLAQIGGDLQQELMELSVDEKIIANFDFCQCCLWWEQTMSEYDRRRRKPDAPPFLANWRPSSLPVTRRPASQAVRWALGRTPAALGSRLKTLVVKNLYNDIIGYCW